MNFTEFTDAATEAFNWAGDHIEISLLTAAVGAGLATFAYLKLRDYFTPATPTAFDDPKIKARRERMRERFQRLGLPYWEP